MKGLYENISDKRVNIMYSDMGHSPGQAYAGSFIKGIAFRQTYSIIFTSKPGEIPERI